MPFIDAQINLWRTGVANLPHRAAPYQVEEAIRDMNEVGIDGAVIHPPESWDPDTNEQAVEAVQAYPELVQIAERHPALKLVVDTWGRSGEPKVTRHSRICRS